MKIENEGFCLEVNGDQEDVVALVVVKNLAKEGLGVAINGRRDDIIKALAIIMHEVADRFVKDDNMSEDEAMKEIYNAIATMKIVRGLMKMASAATEVQ